MRGLAVHDIQARIAGTVLDLDQPEIAVEAKLAFDPVLDCERIGIKHELETPLAILVGQRLRRDWLSM